MKEFNEGQPTISSARGGAERQVFQSQRTFWEHFASTSNRYKILFLFSFQTVFQRLQNLNLELRQM
jgi:hypothetical protein